MRALTFTVTMIIVCLLVSSTCLRNCIREAYDVEQSPRPLFAEWPNTWALIIFHEPELGLTGEGYAKGMPTSSYIHECVYMSPRNVISKYSEGVAPGDLGWNVDAPTGTKRPKWFGPTFTAKYSSEDGPIIRATACLCVFA